jgi:hypothetical protein
MTSSPVLKTKHSRVAFLGNMNNNHFAMARYLRDRGVDCSLFLLPDEFDHFHPSCDTYRYDFRDWVHQLPWGGRRTFLDVRPDKMRDVLAKFDLRVGCGLAPAICHRAGLPLDVFVPYGGDLWTETKFGLHRALRNSIAATYSQRAGLAKVSIVHSPPMIASYEAILSRYWRGINRWNEGVPMVYAPEYARENLEVMMGRSHWGHEFQRIRQSCEFMVVSHVRHAWGPITNPAVKGNDVLLKGWSKFRRKRKSTRAKLVLLEYGQDVNRSKELAYKLGVVDTVEWLPRMLRKDIMPGLLLADAVAGEFIHSWDAGGVIYEALVARKPLVMHRDISEGLDIGRLFPVFKASNSDEVASQLELLATSPDMAKKVGDAGFDWFMANVAHQGTERYLTHLNSTSA